MLSSCTTDKPYNSPPPTFDLPHNLRNKCCNLSSISAKFESPFKENPTLCRFSAPKQMETLEGRWNLVCQHRECGRPGAGQRDKAWDQQHPDPPSSVWHTPGTQMGHSDSWCQLKHEWWAMDNNLWQIPNEIDVKKMVSNYNLARRRIWSWEVCGKGNWPVVMRDSHCHFLVDNILSTLHSIVACQRVFMWT